jgi:DNA modification methylase
MTESTLHRLINGDARDLSFLQDESVHLVVTSPPYWNLNLNPIIWHKIANASYEVSNGSKFLGKPYEPNAIIKNDMEFILMQRKPGGYRSPTAGQRDASRIAKTDFDRWFQQIWNITGASTKNHPAPFPLELAMRLVRMFSFAGDTVLDPFCGSGTTMIAALRSGRNSVGVEIDPDYCRMAARYLKAEANDLFSSAKLIFEKAEIDRLHSAVREDHELYSVRPARKRLEK